MQLNIRMRLLLLVGITSLLALSVLLFLALGERNQARLQIMAEMEVHARRIAEQQNDVLNHVQQILSVIYDLKRLDVLPEGEACNQFLARMIAADSRLGNALIADEQGLTICKGIPTPKPTNIADRPYFQRALSSDQVVVGNPVVSRANQKWVLPVARSLRTAAGRTLVMVVTLDLEWVNHELAHLAYANDGRIGLIDSQGLVLARYPDPEKRVGSNAINSRFFKDLWAHGGKGTAESVGYDKVQRLYGFSPFADTMDRHIYLYVGVSKADVLAEVDRKYYRIVSFFMLIFLLLVGIVWLGGDRLLLRPVRHIANVTRRLGLGEYGARTQLSYPHDEIGVLAESVDKMAEQLMSHSEVLRLNRSLKLLNECEAALIHADSETELLGKICQLCVESGGYVMAWVGMAEHDAAKTVRPVAQFGHEAGYLEHAVISWGNNEYGQGPTGMAIRLGQTSVSQNILINPVMHPWREAAIQRGYQASIALPLRHKQHTLGALTLYAAAPDAFQPKEIELLESLAKDLAFGIQSLRTEVQHDAAQQKLAFWAHHDPLTHLANRALLCERFEQAASFARQKSGRFALLFLDIDNFKQINDGLGHGVGDQLLTYVAARLQQHIHDIDTLSRQGGDEFIILFNQLHDLQALDLFAQHLVDAFAEPIGINGYTLYTTLSIGVSVYPDDGTSMDTLLTHADAALYQAKQAGKNTYRRFSLQMKQDALEYIQIQRDLRQALENKEFFLNFQPKVDAKTQRIVGAEALVRWQHPLHGLISPAKFIPIAERSGLIIPLGAWVLHEACQAARRWTTAQQLPSIIVAVNLSAQQFKRSNVVELVELALKKSGLPAGQLELELTESVLMHDLGLVKQTLQSLKEMGVSFSIDDFGTGYSSLAYLKQLAVDKLKIDQSFVREMLNNQEDAEIVKAIIALGNALHLGTIAEGVETQAQFNALQAYGCDVIQGYYFSRPLSEAAFVEFFRANIGEAEVSDE